MTGFVSVEMKDKTKQKNNAGPDLGPHCFFAFSLLFHQSWFCMTGFVSVEMKDKTKQKNQCGA